MKIVSFFKKSFSDMKNDAMAQHEADKAELRAVKAESRASFEENRGRNTLARARKNSKAMWDSAHAAASVQAAARQSARDERISAATAREAAANERYESARTRRTEK